MDTRAIVAESGKRVHARGKLHAGSAGMQTVRRLPVVAIPGAARGVGVLDKLRKRKGMFLARAARPQPKGGN